MEGFAVSKVGKVTLVVMIVDACAEAAVQFQWLAHTTLRYNLKKIGDRFVRPVEAGAGSARAGKPHPEAACGISGSDSPNVCCPTTTTPLLARHFLSRHLAPHLRLNST